VSGIFVPKNYQNLVAGFQVTVENVGDVFLGHSVLLLLLLLLLHSDTIDVFHWRNVFIVVGETGSVKSTQVTQFILEVDQLVCLYGLVVVSSEM